MTCKQCGRAVRNRFQSKWKHIVNYHPEIMAKHLLPLILDSDKARALGETFARRLAAVSKV